MPASLPAPAQAGCVANDANSKCKAPNGWNVCSGTCEGAVGATYHCNDDTLAVTQGSGATGYCSVSNMPSLVSKHCATAWRILPPCR